MTHPAIEQAVKTFDYLIKHCKLLLMLNKDWALYIPRMPHVIEDAEQAITSLRAMQQEPVSKTDEELAHHLASELADTIEGVTCGDDIHRYLVPNKAIPLITQAFAAIRKQARDEALDDAKEASPVLDGQSNEYWRGVTDMCKAIEQLKATK